MTKEPETTRPAKPVRWIASSRRDLQALPEDVKNRIGYALWRAQLGEMHESAKALKGFGDASVIEIVDDFDGSTYRAVYTVRFAAAVYVLHVFQKKSKRGAKTPPRDKALIYSRLELAKQDAKNRKEK